jgi:drug/metabolite transporter (DMT)-like permease
MLNSRHPRSYVASIAFMAHALFGLKSYSISRDPDFNPNLVISTLLISILGFAVSFFYILWNNGASKLSNGSLFVSILNGVIMFLSLLTCIYNGDNHTSFKTYSFSQYVYCYITISSILHSLMILLMDVSEDNETFIVQRDTKKKHPDF